MNNKPVALITGGAQRIGAAIATMLHEKGFNIVIHYNQSKEAAQALTTTLNQQRDNSALCLQATLDDTPALKTLIDQAYRQWNRLDALVNNASGFYPTPVSEATEQDWDSLINSNTKGAFFLCQAASPLLAKHQGCIVNIVDIHAQKPLKDYSLYCIAKAGLAMLTQSLAKELAPIRVNGIAPGAILWPEANNKNDEEFNEQTQQKIVKKIPLGRPGEPNDIAKTAAFLICDAPYITGQIIAVDGGRSLSM